MKTPIELAMEYLRRIASGEENPQEIARRALEMLEDYEEVMMQE